MFDTQTSRWIIPSSWTSSDVLASCSTWALVVNSRLGGVPFLVFSATIFLLLCEPQKPRRVSQFGCYYLRGTACWRVSSFGLHCRRHLHCLDRILQLAPPHSWLLRMPDMFLMGGEFGYPVTSPIIFSHSFIPIWNTNTFETHHGTTYGDSLHLQHSTSKKIWLVVSGDDEP